MNQHKYAYSEITLSKFNNTVQSIGQNLPLMQRSHILFHWISCPVYGGNSRLQRFFQKQTYVTTYRAEIMDVPENEVMNTLHLLYI